MDDVRDPDEWTEVEGRRLLTAAFDTAPAAGGPAGNGMAGADLLRGVRRQISRRRRARTLVPAGAIAMAAGSAVAVTLLTASVAGAPPALAAVTAAAAKTSADSFHVTVIRTAVSPVPGSRMGATRLTGKFDPSRGVGEEFAAGGIQIRFIGDHTYARIPGRTVAWHGKPWEEGLIPAPDLAPLPQTGADASTGFNGDEPVDPGALLGLIKSAGSVTDEGPTSGPGWTGTKYAFTARLPKDPLTMVVGTVDVDRQGQVRHLLTNSEVRLGSTSAQKTVTITNDVTFSDFGVPVSVTAPPASQVYAIG